MLLDLLFFQAADIFDELKQNEAADLKAYQDAQKKFEAVSLGLALNDEGEATSLQDQLTSKNRQNFPRFSLNRRLF